MFSLGSGDAERKNRDTESMNLLEFTLRPIEMLTRLFGFFNDRHWNALFDGSLWKKKDNLNQFAIGSIKKCDDDKIQYLLNRANKNPFDFMCEYLDTEITILEKEEKNPKFKKFESRNRYNLHGEDGFHADIIKQAYYIFSIVFIHVMFSNNGKWQNDYVFKNLKFQEWIQKLKNKHVLCIQNLQLESMINNGRNSNINSNSSNNITSKVEFEYGCDFYRITKPIGDNLRREFKNRDFNIAPVVNLIFQNGGTYERDITSFQLRAMIIELIDQCINISQNQLYKDIDFNTICKVFEPFAISSIQFNNMKLYHCFYKNYTKDCQNLHCTTKKIDIQNKTLAQWSDKIKNTNIQNDDVDDVDVARKSISNSQSPRKIRARVGNRKQRKQRRRQFKRKGKAKNLKTTNVECTSNEKKLSKFYKCKNCRMVFYCCRKCQKRDWIHHRTICDKLRKLYLECNKTRT